MEAAQSLVSHDVLRMPPYRVAEAGKGVSVSMEWGMSGKKKGFCN